MLLRAAVVNVPVRGVDPRDLLRGHYIGASSTGSGSASRQRRAATPASTRGLCVLAGDSAEAARALHRQDWTRATRPATIAG